MNEWWASSVIYQIYPRSFADENGDGFGDLAGIVDHVEYLEWLGVSGVWICPFYRSPMIDGGYDISDFTDVDPVFGSIADFDRLVAALHERHIRIITDFVPNHSSDQHPWFLDSRSRRTSPKRDWYVWAPAAEGGAPPSNWESYFGGSAWEYDQASGDFYLHTYHRGQPDLDWRNPQVRAAMADVIRFWLDRGADGIRADALWILGKDARLTDNPPNPQWAIGQPFWDRQLRLFSEDQPTAHEYARFIRSVVDEYPEAVMLAEVVLPPRRAVTYYGSALDEAHLPLNFALLELEDWSAGHIAHVVDDYLSLVPCGASPNWFLGNHDFERVASRIGAGRARLAHFMMLTLPGTPILYYGDELGLPNGVIPPELVRDPQAAAFPERSREAARTPMPWDSAAGLGFSSDPAWRPASRPQPEFSVQLQREDAASHLNLIRNLIRLRRRHQALSTGEYRRTPTETEGIFCYTRSLSTDRFMIILNFGDKCADVTRLIRTTAILELATSPLSQNDDNVVQPAEGRLYLLK